jgi:geranylgeranyl pyrophosphate synthase
LKGESPTGQLDLSNREQSLNIMKGLCEREGTDGWELAKKAILSTPILSTRLRRIINRTMKRGQPDYFRPALLSLCCSAVGGTSRATASLGAFFILTAKAIGIHDDIIDHSETKEGRKTILGEYGQDSALILSDILLFKSFTMLQRTLHLGVSTEDMVAILSTIDKTWTSEQSSAEALDLEFRNRFDLSPQRCLTKITMVASEIEAIARAGGILGRSPQPALEVLGNYGRLLGTNAILTDEIVDMLQLSALKKRLKTETAPLPLIYALETERSPEVTTLLDESKLNSRTLKTISRFATSGMKKVSKMIEANIETAHNLTSQLAYCSEELNLLIDSTSIDTSDCMS